MDFKQIKELIKIVDSNKINNVTITDKDFSISIDKTPIAVTSAPVMTQATVQEIAPASTQQPVTNEISTSTDNKDYIKSPMVGTFYEASSPNSAPFAKVGDTVKKGDTVGIIEAMKIMNEIEAEFDCKIIKALVSNENPTEFNTPLFEVEKL